MLPTPGLAVSGITASRHARTGALVQHYLQHLNLKCSSIHAHCMLSTLKRVLVPCKRTGSSK